MTIIRLSISKTLALIVSLTLVGCAVSTDFDKQVGAQNAQSVVVQMGLVDMPALQSYVDEVGQKLVRELGPQPFEFQFKVVDAPMPNAFALPGGYIFISRGLLVLMNSEDELAGVLSHEIAHVTQRHGVKQLRSSIVPGLLELPGQVIGVFSDDLGKLINAPITTGNELLLAGYSRSHETEADTLGAALAARAGYNPVAMGDILSRMNRTIEYTTEQRIEKSYFDSHPFTTDRVANINEMSHKLTIGDSQAITQAFPTKLDQLVVGDNPDKGVFKESQFLHPTIAFTMDFPDGWQLLNQPLAVAAITEDQQNSIVFSGVNNQYDAKENAQRFKQAVEERYELEANIESITLADEQPAYLITLDASKDGKIIYLNQLWVDKGDATYRIAALAQGANQPRVLASIKSFRDMSEQDYAMITVDKLVIATVTQSQSIEAINRNKNGISDLTLIKIINGIDENASQVSDRQLKIITTQPYQQAKQ